jgi:ribonuclease D
VIDTDEKLAAFLPKLRDAAWIALDTEADSLYAYPEKICLLQFSVAGRDELLDPLSPMDLAPVWEAVRRHELIMHGADYDLRLLRKGYRLVPRAVFDTMIASRLLGCRQFGLNNLLLKYLGVTLEKGPQKANWAKRPLTERMTAYALNDVRHLKALADILQNQLRDLGRLAWHQESCSRQVADCAKHPVPDPDLIWRVKGSHRLDPAALGVLRELWRWREQEAVHSNKPPYFVLATEKLVEVAAAAADSRPVEEVLPRHLTPRRRDAIRDAVKQGLDTEKRPSILRHQNKRPTETESRRARELERRRDQRATELDLDATLIASRAMLMDLARDWDKYQPGLMSWQRELLTKDEG